MTEKVKNIAVVITMALFLGVFSIWNLVKPAEEISVSERRELKQFPELSAETLLSGKFTGEFEKYAADQFPMRDQFRTLHSLVKFYGLRQTDNQGIYMAEGYVSSIEYPLNEDSLAKAAQRFRYLYETYLEGKDMKLYFSIIPDKNYFLAEQNGYLAMDYERLVASMREQTPYLQYIDIFDLLELSDYYRTDTHWRQEKIVDVAKRIGGAMGAPLSGTYTEKLLDRPFYGVYYGQAALPMPADSLYYLENDVLRECTVFDYESQETGTVYNMEKAYGKDPYEMYLSGSRSLLTIENPNGDAERELIIFRDSFGSSLAPLLVEGYGRITLVDIRYLQSSMLKNLLTFDNQDVLFLYSTQVLNNSVTMK